MNTKQFGIFADTIGLRVLGSTASGIVRNWPVSTMLYNGSIRITLSLAPGFPKTTARDIRRELKGIATASLTANGTLVLMLKVKRNGPAPEEQLLSALSVLSELGLHTQDSCPYCRQSGCDTAAFTKAGYHTCHRTCLENAAATLEEQAEQNENSGSYFTGFLGALLGMMVGCIPTLLLIMAADYIVVYLFALIPLCAYYGCKLLHGKMNRAALIVSVLMSVLGVYFINFVQLSLYYQEEYILSFGETLNVFGLLLIDPEVWGLITTNSITYFLFAALGVVFVWALISRTTGGAAKDARAAVETALPWPQDRASVQQSGSNSGL